MPNHDEQGFADVNQPAWLFQLGPLVPQYKSFNISICSVGNDVEGTVDTAEFTVLGRNVAAVTVVMISNKRTARHISCHNISFIQNTNKYWDTAER